jgi:hypothetical protein
MRHGDNFFRLIGTSVTCFAIFTAAVVAGQQQPSAGLPSKTQVVLLGTGNPFRDLRQARAQQCCTPTGNCRVAASCLAVASGRVFTLLL